jgi:hypothetical protein
MDLHSAAGAEDAGRFIARISRLAITTVLFIAFLSFKAK